MHKNAVKLAKIRKIALFTGFKFDLLPAYNLEMQNKYMYQ